MTRKLLIFILLPALAWGLIGYDCGARSLNITTISTLNVEECQPVTNNLNIMKRYIQLLQINDFLNTKVLQCKLEIHRTIYKCGMFSHLTLVENSESEYLYEISRDKCKQAHETGLYKFDNKVISGLKINQTSTHSIRFAGVVKDDGACTGAVFSDPYGTWDNAVVQGIIRITLKEHMASVDMNQNKIILRSGTRCTLSDLTCVDYDGGYTFWDIIPIDRCELYKYGLLYEGYANKIIDTTFNAEEVVYTLSTEDVTFSLITKGKINVCGMDISKTEHPKLLIHETIKGTSLINNNKISVENLDMFAYINSKFVFVERHIKTQIKNLYEDIIMHRCKEERRILENALAIASRSPDQFAYNLMKGPGYMAIAAGEVVHIIKCIPVEVKIAHVDQCYEELPVMRNNKTMFLTPKTHILKSRGILTECNGLLPTYYQINKMWYKVLPKVIESKEPMILRPIQQTTWKYEDPASLATSGIYTEKDLKDLRDRVMFPLNEPALLNSIAREINGHAVTDNEGVIAKLINDNTMEKILTNTWNSMWSKFTTFGSVSAGIFTLIIIIQGIKMFFGVILKGYALHRIYGWSAHLLSAFWGSLATFFIALGQERQQQTSSAPPPNEPRPEPEERYVQTPTPSFPAKLSTTPTAPLSIANPAVTYSVINENPGTVSTYSNRIKFAF